MENSNTSSCMFSHSSFYLQGSITSIGKDSATLSTGETLSFDYAVIATGSTNLAGTREYTDGRVISEHHTHHIVVMGFHSGYRCYGFPQWLSLSRVMLVSAITS